MKTADVEEYRPTHIIHDVSPALHGDTLEHSEHVHEHVHATGWEQGGGTHVHTGTYIIHDVSPALHGDTLEHSEHGKTKVVKVGDAVVRTVPIFITDQTFFNGTVVALPTWVRLIYHLICGSKIVQH